MPACGIQSRASWRGQSRQTLAQNARTFALLNLALHDLAVALVETKYYYHFWRPETAIVAGGTDGNGRTQPDASYRAAGARRPVIPAIPRAMRRPAAPRAKCSSARFGARGHRIVVSQPAMPGVKLEYSTLEEITDDIDDARVYGGIHFRFDQKGGAEQGRNVGAYVFRQAFKPAGRCHCPDR